MSNTNDNQRQLTPEEKIAAAAEHMDNQIFMREFFGQLKDRTGWMPKNAEQAIRIREAAVQLKQAYYQQQAQQAPVADTLNELILRGVEKVAGLQTPQAVQQQEDELMMRKAAELAQDPTVSTCLNILKPVLQQA